MFQKPPPQKPNPNFLAGLITITMLASGAGALLLTILDPSKGGGPTAALAGTFTHTFVLAAGVLLGMNVGRA